MASARSSAAVRHRVWHAIQHLAHAPVDALVKQGPSRPASAAEGGRRAEFVLTALPTPESSPEGRSGEARGFALAAGQVYADQFDGELRP